MSAPAPAETPAAPERPVLDLMKHREYWRWVSAVTALRLPSLMAPFSIILISIHYTGSPAVGGLIVAVSMAPTVLFGPAMGRLLDRLGPAEWTPRLMLFGAAMRVVLVIAFVLHWPVVVLAGLALVGNAATCAIGGVARALLQQTVPQRLIGTALSLDSVYTEAIVIAAPFVVVVAAIPGSHYPMLLLSAFNVATALLLRNHLAALSRDDEPAETAEPQPGGKWELLRNREFVFWVLVAAALGQIMGTVDLAVLPLAISHGGGTAHAAVLSAALGVMAALTGFSYAWFGNRIHVGPRSQARLLLLLIIFSMGLIAFGAHWVVLVVAFGLVGLWSVPLGTVEDVAAGQVLPPERMSEGFNVLNSAGMLGFIAASGLLAVLPVQAVLVVGPTMAVVALVSSPFLLRSAADGATTPDSEPLVAAKGAA